MSRYIFIATVFLSTIIFHCARGMESDFLEFLLRQENAFPVTPLPSDASDSYSSSPDSMEQSPLLNRIKKQLRKYKGDDPNAESPHPAGKKRKYSGDNHRKRLSKRYKKAPEIEEETV